MTQEERGLIINYYNNGKERVTDVAAHFNMKYADVYNMLKAYGHVCLRNRPQGTDRLALKKSESMRSIPLESTNHIEHSFNNWKESNEYDVLINKRKRLNALYDNHSSIRYGKEWKGDYVNQALLLEINNSLIEKLEQELGYN